MVHDVFKLGLHHGFISMSEINLIIVDECHHSLKNSSYNQIFTNHYHPLKGVKKLPHIIGLTASIVTKKMQPHQFPIMVKEIEKVLDAKVITCSNMRNILKYVTQPEEITETYEASEELSFLDPILFEGLSKIKRILIKELNRIKRDYSGIEVKKHEKEANETFKKFKRFLDQTYGVKPEILEVLDTSKVKPGILEVLGTFHGECIIKISKEYQEEEILMRTVDPYKVELAQAVKEVHSKALSKIVEHNSKCQDVKNLSPTFLDGFRQSFQERFQSNFDNRRHPYSRENFELEQLSSNKFKKLLEILEGFDISPMKALVFVQERQMASTLASLLTRASKIRSTTLGHLKCSYAVGGQTRNMFKEPTSKLMQELVERQRLKLENTLNEFRSGKMNCKSWFTISLSIVHLFYFTISLQVWFAPMFWKKA